MSTWWNLLADAIVVVHLAYLLFIPVGGFLAWRWHSVIPIHMAAILVGLVSITIVVSYLGIFVCSRRYEATTTH